MRFRLRDGSLRLGTRRIDGFRRARGGLVSFLLNLLLRRLRAYEAGRDGDRDEDGQEEAEYSLHPALLEARMRRPCAVLYRLQSG